MDELEFKKKIKKLDKKLKLIPLKYLNVGELLDIINFLNYPYRTLEDRKFVSYVDAFERMIQNVKNAVDSERARRYMDYCP